MLTLGLYLLRTAKSECCSSVYTQLISRIEEGGLETEGLLRIPGAAMRIKVGSWFSSLKLYDLTILLHFKRYLVLPTPSSHLKRQNRKSRTKTS